MFDRSRATHAAKRNWRRGLTVAAATAGVVVLSAGTGYTAAMINSADIRNQSIRSVDISQGGVGASEVRNGSVGQAEVKRGGVDHTEIRDNGVRPGDLGNKFQADATNELEGVEADGPYPGTTDLGSLEGQGDNSAATVPADGARHTVWVECAPGKVALGGGFRLAADNTQAAAEAINVIASEPRGVAIEGDPAQSLRPTGWQVEVVNNGDTDQVVRPWVVCADHVENSYND